MRYREATRRDFDALATTDGAIYHQRGGYEIIDGGDILIPANRSYRQLEIEDMNLGRGSYAQLSREGYTNRDRIINDSVDDVMTLRRDERILSVYGKRFFALNTSCDNVWQEFSTNTNANGQASKESDYLVGCLKEVMNTFEELSDIGVYGSHQMGINRGDSDLDLVAWVTREGRQDAIACIGSALEQMDYVSVHNYPELLGKYATRYAKRMGLSTEVGYALAKQRLRWISPGGVSTSLQCLHSDYNHDWAEDVVNNGFGDIETRTKVLIDQVEIIGRPEAYNFPRLWKVSVGGDEPTDVISLDWAHQSMGTDIESMHSMRASKVVTALGNTAYVLSSQSDFILPVRIG